jgi:hypothetical protein
MLKDLVRISFAFVLTVLALAAACSSAEETAQTQVFTAVDYAFQGPSEIPAGWAELRVANIGRELHHGQLVRLSEGTTGDELLALFGGAEVDAGTDAFGAFELAGGPSAAAPGTANSAYAELEAGEYLLICAIPNAEGVPHYALGMFKALTVTDNKEPAGPPEEDLSMNLIDFGFEMSEEVTAGTHTFKVTNAGPQDHEALLVELNRGASAEDFLAAFGPGAPPGPPPGKPVGGVQVIEAGDEGYFTTTFMSNRTYALLCFVEDPETGAPHFALGMVDEFTVE